jgi:hypothetical protein
LLRNVFHSQHRLIQLSTIHFFLSLGRFVDCLELHKGIVPFHFDPQQLSVGFKEHFQIFPLRRFLVEIDHKECVAGLNALTAIIFLALDTSISTSKLSTECIGNTWDLPVE